MNNKVYYTVLTLLDDDEKLLNYIQLHKEKFIRIMVVVEYGKTGGNKHYNIVYEPRALTFHTNANKFWKTLYTPQFLENLPNTKYLIKTKNCYNYQNVVGGYLLKEKDCKVLYNLNYLGGIGFNVEDCKQIAQENLDKIEEAKITNIYQLIRAFIMPYESSTRYVDTVEMMNKGIADIYRTENVKYFYILNRVNFKRLHQMIDALRGQDIFHESYL